MTAAGVLFLVVSIGPPFFRDADALRLAEAAPLARHYAGMKPFAVGFTCRVVNWMDERIISSSPCFVTPGPAAPSREVFTGKNNASRVKVLV